MKRAVITGLGLITPVGANVPQSWQKIIDGKSGIRSIPDSIMDTSELSCKVAGLVPTKEEGGLDLSNFLAPKDARKMDRFIQLAIAATDEAWKDAGIELKSEAERNRAGVIVGSGIGGLPFIEQNTLAMHEKGPRRVSPFLLPASLINLAAGHISIRYGLKGINSSIVSACSTGTHCIGEALRAIQLGHVDIMVAGGSEAAICKLGIAGFASMKALSSKYNDSPESSSRPWDKDRDGFVMGEGAGILVLEEYEHAKKRGAKVYAEVVGYGATSDAYHITAPEETGDGGYRAMKLALEDAKTPPSNVNYINAHATSTPLGDIVELEAIKRMFGNTKDMVVSSTKSAIGHLLGAAGSVEAIFSILALRDQIAPPTLNLDNPPEDCNIDLVPFTAKEMRDAKYALSNSFGFGGTNASLLFKKV